MNIRQRQILDTLRLTPFFAQLSTDDLAHLAEHASFQHFRGGEILFRQGELSDNFYIVVSGHVVLYLDGEDDPANIARIVGPGATFGEGCVFAQGGNPVTAQVFGASDIIIVPSPPLCCLLADRVEVVLGLIAEVSIRLRALLRQIMDLKMKTTAQRLGGYLLGLTQASTGPADIKLPFEKKLLASQLGMQPETLSRALFKLQALGVRYQRSQDVFRVRDVALLRHFCDESGREDPLGRRHATGS